MGRLEPALDLEPPGLPRGPGLPPQPHVPAARHGRRCFLRRQVLIATPTRGAASATAAWFRRPRRGTILCCRGGDVFLSPAVRRATVVLLGAIAVERRRA